MAEVDVHLMGSINAADIYTNDGLVINAADIYTNDGLVINAADIYTNDI